MRSFTSFLSTGLFIKGIIQDKNNVFLEAKGVAEEHCSELMPAVLMETGASSSCKEPAVHTAEWALEPLPPEGEQRVGLIEVTCLSLQVEREVVISLPSYCVGEFPVQLKGA